MADQKPKPISTLEVKLKGEIYSRVYSMKDLQEVIDLINDMYSNEVHIVIAEAKETKIK